jgi:hypothetical protein
MMLRQALVANGARTLLPVMLVGGAAIAGAALLWGPRVNAPSLYRLTLHAPVDSKAFYLSAWNDGEVFIDHDARDHKAVVFTRRGDEHDGCTWLGTERLVPIAVNAYHYSYEETILSCRPGAMPFYKTPRAGIVTVERASGPATLTALSGVQPPGSLWNPSVTFGDDGDDSDDGDDGCSEAMAELQEAAAEAMAEAQAAIRDAQLDADEVEHEVEAAVAAADHDDSDHDED